MKKNLFCLTFLMCSISAYAFNPNCIFWNTKEDAYVKTAPNAIIYGTESYDKTEVYLNEFIENQIINNHQPYDIKRYRVDYVNNKSKTIRKPQEFKVRGYCNQVAQLEYDTYLIEIKGHLYYLPAEYVADNHLIDDINSSVNKYYKGLNSNLDNISKEIDSVRVNYLEMSKKQQLYYENLIDTLQSKINMTRTNAAVDFKEQIKLEYDTWYNSLPSTTQEVFDNVITINSVKLDPPGSYGWCDFSLNYTNKSDRTIKYLYWTGTFYNAVNDPVYCVYGESSSCTGEEVGPIAPNQNGGKKWDNVICNQNARYVELTNITILYTDGLKTTITHDLDGLVSYVKLLERLDKYGTIDNVVNESAEEYEIQLRKAETELKKWKERVEWFSMIPENDREALDYYNIALLYEEDNDQASWYNKLLSLYAKKTKCRTEISEFEHNNYLRR